MWLISKSLCHAYLTARYRVFAPGGTIEFSARGYSPELAALQDAHNVHTSAFITAWNPFSHPTDVATNTANHERLIRRISPQWRHLPGEGVDPSGKWPAEPSVLVLGVELEMARALGREFQQHGIVWVCATGDASLWSSEPENGPVLQISSQTRLEPNGEIFVKTSPGGYWYRREMDGTYAYHCFVLGGSGGGKSTVPEVASRLIQGCWAAGEDSLRETRQRLYRVLENLGWDEVIAYLAEMRRQSQRSSRS